MIWEFFRAFLFCSDVDGTFSVNTVTVPENIDAVKYFIKNGGRFTIATGRTAAYLKRLDFFECINAPACICNGSIVYDYEKEEILRTEYEDFTLGEFLNAVNKLSSSLSGLYVYYTPKTVQAPNTADYEFTKDELSKKPTSFYSCLLFIQIISPTAIPFSEDIIFTFLNL